MVILWQNYPGSEDQGDGVTLSFFVSLLIKAELIDLRVVYMVDIYCSAWLNILF